ncbi:MAG TPA: carboxylating nicotinate-nucleotide diphosphorylase [Thermodesulfobacteriaceae bacterium]|nr:carboxylating nicotinate-nucleotide diphosphorylase [Thermodesulfobacteriaceae bacterium]
MEQSTCIPHFLLYRGCVAAALEEDLEHGDITTELTISRAERGRSVIIAKEETVVAGTFAAAEAFRLTDPGVHIDVVSGEGGLVQANDCIMKIEGRLAAMLQAERVALNFLQRMCGVAALTRRFVEEISGQGCRLVDTRKTTPGMRLLQKYAVRAGGGCNHRYGLSDGILIKDNHIAACGSVSEAVARARAGAPHLMKIQVEVTDVRELEEAVAAGADALLLDNMDVHTLAENVNHARKLKPDIVLEASGGIRLENVLSVARTGVDIISVGGLTHSAPAADLSLKITGRS